MAPNRTGEATRSANVLLPPGTRVEVRSSFEGTWSKGFRVVQGCDGGYLVERSADKTVLPLPIPADRVRRERRRETWWI